MRRNSFGQRLSRMSVTGRLEKLAPVFRPSGYLRGVWRTLSRRPALILPSTLCFIVCTIAIVIAVVLSAEKTEQVERDKAQLLLTSTATVRAQRSHGTAPFPRLDAGLRIIVLSTV